MGADLAVGGCEGSCNSQGTERVVEVFGGTWGAPWGVLVRDPLFASFVEGTAVMTVGRERAGDVIVSLFKGGTALCAKHLMFGFVPELRTGGG